MEESSLLHVILNHMDTKSPHILTTSSNLLGFSFLILSSIKGFGLHQAGYIGVIVAFCIVSFALSALFSFISIRSKSESDSMKYENIADYIFLGGLTVLAAIAVLLASDFVTFAK